MRNMYCIASVYLQITMQYFIMGREEIEKMGFTYLNLSACEKRLMIDGPPHVPCLFSLVSVGAFRGVPELGHIGTNTRQSTT